MLDGDINLTELMRSMHWMAICHAKQFSGDHGKHSWKVAQNVAMGACRLACIVQCEVHAVATAIANTLVALPQLDMRPRAAGAPKRYCPF